MAKIHLPHVQSFKDRHGRRRFYYRRTGYERVTLPDPSDATFLAAYAEASREKAPIGTERTIPNSIRALVISYYGSPSFARLQPQTQANYRNILDRFCVAFGGGSALTIETRHFDQIFADMADRPGAARNLRKRLRSVFRHGVKQGLRRDNPVNESDAPSSDSVGFVPWTEGEIDAFRQYWPTGSRERLAFELLLNTGVRRSDVIGLGRHNISNGRLRLIQAKTGKPVTLPIHPDLTPEIEGRDDATFLVTQYGQPFTEAGFTQWFGEKADAAGCEGRTPHGLRKAAGRRLAEAGCSAKQIAAVLGHSSTRLAEVYTKDADRELLADAAFGRLTLAQGCQPRSQPETKTLDNQGLAGDFGRPGGTVTAVEFQPRRLSTRPKRRH